MLQREQFATGLGEGGRVRTLEYLRSAARDMVAGRTVEAIGISCAGPLDSRRGVILCPPNLDGWEGVPITRIFQEEFHTPTYLENDANAGALAEWKFGAGKGLSNLVFLTFGTGMGAGLVLDGRLYRGSSDAAGEVGHIRLAEQGPIGYHRQGSFEGFCSGPGLAQLMAAELAAAPKAAGSAEDQEADRRAGQLTGRDVVELARDGDPLALKAVTTSGKHLGRGLAVLVDILNPEMIVVGGMGSRLGDLLLGPARTVLADEALAVGVEACRIVPAALGEQIGDYAALCVALEHSVAGG
jgi:glucokinase